MEEQVSARNVAVELFPASGAAEVFGKSAAPAAEAAEKHAASVTEKVLSLMTAFCAMGQKPVLSVAEQGRSRTNSQ